MKTLKEMTEDEISEQMESVIVKIALTMQKMQHLETHNVRSGIVLVEKMQNLFGEMKELMKEVLRREDAKP